MFSVEIPRFRLLVIVESPCYIVGQCKIHWYVSDWCRVPPYIGGLCKFPLTLVVSVRSILALVVSVEIPHYIEGCCKCRNHLSQVVTIEPPMVQISVDSVGVMYGQHTNCN